MKRYIYTHLYLCLNRFTLYDVITWKLFMHTKAREAIGRISLLLLLIYSFITSNYIYLSASLKVSLSFVSFRVFHLKISNFISQSPLIIHRRRRPPLNSMCACALNCTRRSSEAFYSHTSRSSSSSSKFEVIISHNNWIDWLNVNWFIWRIIINKKIILLLKCSFFDSLQVAFFVIIF